MCIGHTITQRKKMKRKYLENWLQKCFKRRNSRKKIETFYTVFILIATFIEHIVTSNVIFHILFNEIFDVANIICMKIMWSILDVIRMRNYKGTSHCMSLLI